MPSPAERFDKFVYPEPNSGCFLWGGGEFVSGGYGKFRLGKTANGKPNDVRAHRFAWERANGPIPAGLHVLNKCDTPLCVNPDHLFLGSDAVNAADMAAKGRGRRSPRGLPFGAKPNPHGGGFTARYYHHYLGTYRTAEEASAVALAAKQKALKEREPAMKSAENNDATPKPASLSPAPVPRADPLPSAAKEGVKSIVQSAG